jgi:hypothetical protein
MTNRAAAASTSKNSRRRQIVSFWLDESVVLCMEERNAHDRRHLNNLILMKNLGVARV